MSRESLNPNYSEYLGKLVNLQTMKQPIAVTVQNEAVRQTRSMDVTKIDPVIAAADEGMVRRTY